MAKASPPPPPEPKKAATPEKARAKTTPITDTRKPKAPAPAAVESPRAKRGMPAKTAPAQAVPPLPAPKPAKKKPRPKKKVAKPRGRPSSYTKKLAAEICRRVARGEYLSDICRGEDMPHTDTVHSWVAEDRKEDKEDALETPFSRLYARAQDDDCDRRLREIEDIAEKPVEFAQTTVRSIGGGKEGEKDRMIKEVKKGDSVEHRRLLISTKQWLAIRQHKRRLALGRDAMRELENGDAPPEDGELHVIIEGGLPTDASKTLPKLPSDPFGDEPKE